MSPPPTPATTNEERPTVLLVGSGDPMEAALSLALGRHGLTVEVSAMKDAMQAVFVHAPDLAVLLGDAAKEEGGEVLADLAGRASTAVVPVALLSDDPDLERRLRAFRYGAVAVVPRSPSADEMARRIAAIVEELPERDKSAGADLGETTLEELIRLVSTRLRTGILSVRAEGQSEGARIVLRGGQPVTEAIEQLVASIRPLVAGPSGPLAFEFEEQPTGRLAAIADAEIAPPGEIDVRSILAGRRFVLIERSPTRADDLVQALRGLGAYVAVVDGEGLGMEKARAIAPEIVVVDARGIGGWASPALRIIRHDLRLRWAALLVARADEIWPEGAPGADLSRLAAGVKPLIEGDLSLTERGKTEEKFSTRIETTGPERFLRALLASNKTLHVRVQHPRAVVDLDLAEGLLVGASAKGARNEKSGLLNTQKPVEASGAAALAVLLGLSSGRAQIEQRKAPSLANMMSPLDDAIAAADREAPPIRPSLPPPSVPPSRSSDAPGKPMFPASVMNDPPELLRQLESLLIDLRQSIPPSAGGSVAVPMPKPLDGSALARLKMSTGVPKPVTAIPAPRVGATAPAGAPAAVAIPRPGAIPGPAPVPNLGARKKTLVGVMAPGLSLPRPPEAPSEPNDESAPEISVPAISVPAISVPAISVPAIPSPPVARVQPPPEPPASNPSRDSESESLANLLEPESDLHEVPQRFPRAIPAPPASVPPTELPSMPPPPMPVLDGAGGLLPAASSALPSPLPTAVEEPIVVPQRRWGAVVAGVLVLMLLLSGAGAAYWFLARPVAPGPVVAGGSPATATTVGGGRSSAAGRDPYGDHASRRAAGPGRRIGRSAAGRCGATRGRRRGPAGRRDARCRNRRWRGGLRGYRGARGDPRSGRRRDARRDRAPRPHRVPHRSRKLPAATRRARRGGHRLRSGPTPGTQQRPRARGLGPSEPRSWSRLRCRDLCPPPHPLPFVAARQLRAAG
jgi:CheY-like chemotaxis protein